MFVVFHYFCFIVSLFPGTFDVVVFLLTRFKWVKCNIKLVFVPSCHFRIRLLISREYIPTFKKLNVTSWRTQYYLPFTRNQTVIDAVARTLSWTLACIFLPVPCPLPIFVFWENTSPLTGIQAYALRTLRESYAFIDSHASGSARHLVPHDSSYMFICREWEEPATYFASFFLYWCTMTSQGQSKSLHVQIRNV